MSWAAAAALLVATIVVIGILRHIFFFDDSYMYYRYAVHLRQGLGLVWNAGGPPTYGLTSQLWVFFCLPFTLLPVGPEMALRLASGLTGVAAFVVMAFTVSRHATSPFLRQPVIALAAVTLPVVAMATFRTNLSSGMDTMLAVLANAGLAFGVLEYVAAPTRRMSFAVGLLSFAAFLARPDSGLCAMAIPFLAWAFLAKPRRLDALVGLVVLPLVLIGAEMLICRWYFGVPLPLGFYAKSARSYAGFQSEESAVQYFLEASACALPWLGAIAATLRRDQLVRLAVFLLPVAATFAYLLTVRQIMGFGGRFYVPCLPFLIVPALLCADAGVARNARRAFIAAPIAVLIACGLYTLSRPAWQAPIKADRQRLIANAVPKPDMPVAASVPLPHRGYKVTSETIDFDIAAHLPLGAKIGSSEVGLLGVSAMQADVIDLVGLNDTTIGLQGMQMGPFLARGVDLIWMPHNDYTGLRAVILSDERLYRQYIVVKDAFDYGVAIRRESPFRPQIEALVRAAWAKVYPTYAFDDYVVKR
ncbi:MAG: hypothetical protein JSR47_01085 [Proteobacteria bacterium]|nr:hypothetical protein [Pseudomonadota bacterium]